MSNPERPLLKIQSQRAMFRNRDQVPYLLRMLWTALVLTIGGALLWSIYAAAQGTLSVEGARVIPGYMLALLVLGALPLLFTGGFIIDRAQNNVRRLGLPLLGPKPFYLAGVEGIGLNHTMNRVFIKMHHDELHEYTLYFPMGQGVTFKLYTTTEKDRAMTLQAEISEFLHLDALPVREVPSWRETT